jgi:hypothetical protein
VVSILVSAAPQHPSNVTRASRKPLCNLAENPYPNPFVSFASFCSIFSYFIFVFHPSPSNIKQGKPETIV